MPPSAARKINDADAPLAGAGPDRARQVLADVCGYRDFR